MAHTVAYDQLRVSIFDTVDALVASAADDLAAILRQAIAEQGSAAVIFATGNSQLAFYQRLQARDDIAWQCITIFHMDEYLGLPEQHPASFRRVLHERLVDLIRLGAFYGIAGDAEDVAAEIERYVVLLTNDVYYGREKREIGQLRVALHRAVVQAIDLTASPARKQAEGSID